MVETEVIYFQFKFQRSFLITKNPINIFAKKSWFVDLRRSIRIKINQSLPLGHFGIIESEQILYLKYCQTYLGALNDTSSKQIVEAINALSFELSSNYDNFF